MTFELGPRAVEWLEGRCINPETAVRLGWYSGRIVYARDDQGRQYVDHVAPDANGKILVLPILENEVVVAEKYRGPNKDFFQKPGGKRTFINGDVLDDPGLISGAYPLVIVEGEPDLATAIDCGYPLSVSVPDGAPNPPADKAATWESWQPADDQQGKFEFMWINRDRLKKIKHYIIAVDNDTNGKYLAEELVRRLGASRCSFVTWPDGCKDLNEVVMKLGPDAARAVLDGAKPYPIKGLYSLADYPDVPPKQTYSTGWPTLDDIYKPFLPSLTVWTGIPGSGKSTFLANLLVNFANLHGWKAVVFSPELPVVPYFRDKLRRIVMGAEVEDMTPEYLARADAWINAHFYFIDHDVIEESDDDLTLEWVCDRVVDAVLRHGVRIFVLDPWNEVEHAKQRGESTDEYQNRALRTLRKVANRYGLAIHVIAHPTKEVADGGKIRTPTGYDIHGSSAWVNKPDHLLVVDLDAERLDVTNIYLRKFRHEGTGRKDRVDMKYLAATSRYVLLDGTETGIVMP